MKALLLCLILFPCLSVRAQVCTGGFGDPVVNFTFGSGTTTYGGALPSGITNMPYVETQCPEGGPDGGYSIVHSPGLDCFTGDWVNFTGDHTGDPNGYFMLINASTPPSDFYVQTVGGLCPATSYQFAAWIVNMAAHSGEIDPNITFSIEKPDGTVIASTQTGDIPFQNPAQWIQFGLFFTTPPGITSVVIRMRNNAPGGYGNDLGLDDITFRTSGPSVSIGIAGHSGDTVTLCNDPANTLQFAGTVASCYTTTAYQWQESTDNGGSWVNIAGAVNPLYAAFPAAAGNYLYRLTSAEAGNIGIQACQVASIADTIVVLADSHPAINITLTGGYACVDSVADFVASPADGGNGAIFQWAVNGTPVVAGGVTYNSTMLANGDQINCTMTSDAQCPVSATVVSNTITVTLTPDVVTAVDVQASANDICQDSLVTFTAIPTNGGSSPSYQWLVNDQPAGADSPVYSTRGLNNGDIVGVLMNAGLPCYTTAAYTAVPMTVYDVPHIQLMPDTIIAAGSHIVLDPIVTGSYDLSQWSPATGLDDPTVLQPTTSPIVTTLYQLDIRNAYGCTASAKERVVVFYDLFMPNAFTPNGDGHNDVYRVPPSLYLTLERFFIYNRWGVLVFSTGSSTEGWDGRMNGRDEPAGTYVWVVRYYNPIVKKVMMKKGTVELVR